MLTVEVEGLDLWQQQVQQMQANLSDLTPFWMQVFGPLYFTSVQLMFSHGGGVSGAGVNSDAWAALSPNYAAWKSKHYPGQPIMVREGALKDSLTWTGSGLGPGGIFEATPTSLTVGTTVPYAGFHQHGTSRMPARPVLPAVDMGFYVPLLQEWIYNGSVSGQG